MNERINSLSFVWGTLFPQGHETFEPVPVTMKRRTKHSKRNKFVKQNKQHDNGHEQLFL